MTEYTAEVNERYTAIMATYDERCTECASARQHFDITAETWGELVAAGITAQDADKILGIFGL